MNLNHLELLRALQETGFNLSKAAAKLHVVQSAASRQLQLFEEELGSPLYHRQGKKLIGLTTLGERIMSEVEVIDLSRRNILALAGDYRTVGGSVSYGHLLTNRLSATAALGLDGVLRDDPALQDFWTASALVGLRYSF